MASRRCTKCKEEKDESQYYKRFRKGVYVGLHSWCRQCNSKANSEWAKTNPKLNAAKAAKYRRKWRYGLDYHEFETMVADQEGKCAICQEVPNHTLYVDHCHSTDKVRQLLCRSCNSALGLLRENPEYIKSMLKYIAKHKE